MRVIAAARSGGSNTGASPLVNRRNEERKYRRGDEMNAQGRIERPQPASDRDDAPAGTPQDQREPDQIDPSHFDSSSGSTMTGASAGALQWNSEAITCPAWMAPRNGSARTRKKSGERPDHLAIDS